MNDITKIQKGFHDTQPYICLNQNGKMNLI